MACYSLWRWQSKTAQDDAEESSWEWRGCRGARCPAGLLKGSVSSLPEEMVLSAGSIEDVEVVEEGMCDWV